jgi:peptide methionine sulfoxide reductase MsrA
MRSIILLHLLASTVGFSILSQPNTSRSTALHAESRRSFLGSFVASAAIAPILSTFPTAAAATAPAAASEDLVDVYFGVGCFWHIQHEFVEAERKLLNRSDAELTSRTGYAGGKATDKEGRVCYHNLLSVADYGKLGHGEVVGMRIPESQIGNFATEYFSYFNPKTGERVDPGDKGGEYRSLIGLPGGVNNPMFKEVELAAKKTGMTLKMGKGNDPDTFGKKLVYVYDINEFPVYQAELYHQFHDDFQSPPYGKKYNSLANMAFEDGRLKVTGCPDRV